MSLGREARLLPGRQLQLRSRRAVQGLRRRHPEGADRAGAGAPPHEDDRRARLAQPGLERGGAGVVDPEAVHKKAGPDAQVPARQRQADQGEPRGVQ